MSSSFALDLLPLVWDIGGVGDGEGGIVVSGMCLSDRVSGGGSSLVPRSSRGGGIIHVEVEDMGLKCVSLPLIAVNWGGTASLLP